MRTGFPRGVHPSGNKQLTADCSVIELETPATVSIPLQQHLGKEAVATVAKGDKVKVGEKIGAADGKISADVFSSVSGEVKAVEKKATANGVCTHVTIANDFEYNEITLPPLSDPTPEQIISRICECGIVGMGGAGFPASVKFTPREKIDTFIINAAECEPYLTCDYRILKEYTEQFLRGAEYIAKALGLNSFYVGTEDNKTDAALIVQETANTFNINATVVTCKTKYPQGAEKQLIYAITKRKVGVGKLPSSVGVIVSNVHTALSVYNAVSKGEKCYRRILTVSGKGVERPGNYLVRTGVSVAELLEYCGGIRDDAVKLISGGPMMGFSQSSADFAVTKTTSGILLLTNEETDFYKPEPCINCASCVKACPMNLMPVYIDACILSGDVDGAQKYGAMNCLECGSCAFVCPAHRPLVQSMRLAKKKIREKGGKK